MEWDDNGMNLTINPLEDMTKNCHIIDEYSSDQDGQESLEDEER